MNKKEILFHTTPSCVVQLIAVVYHGGKGDE